MAECDVLVLGCGVIGLTTGICLAEAGLTVRVWAKDLPQDTTSAVAGAMWSPYQTGGDHVLDWSRHTYTVLGELATLKHTGVRMASTLRVSRAPSPSPPPFWAPVVPDLRRCRPEELPPGFADGFRCTVPVADMPAYLAYLLARFQAAGGHLEQRTVRSLTEATTAAPVVVNCTGLGARELVPDPQVTPLRGQLVIVGNPGLTDVFVEQTGNASQATYVIPHSDTVVLGGTVEENNWRTTPDPVAGQKIIDRCAAVFGELATVPVLAHVAGLRPARPHIRLEEETRAGVRVLHAYGHGGSGVTTSWGCAQHITTRVIKESR